MLALENATVAPIVTSTYNLQQLQQPTYLSQVKLGVSHVNGNTVQAIFGSSQALRGLDLSAADTSSNRLKNQGYGTGTYTLAELKNHMFVDERTRRTVNELLAGANTQDEVNMITRTQQQQTLNLMSNALVTREIMFAQALTTGKIQYTTNNIDYVADFNMDPSQFVTVGTEWGNKDSSVTDDIDGVVKTLDELNGGSANITTAIMNRTTYSKLAKSGQIINTLGINLNSSNIAVSNSQVNTVFSDATGINIYVYDKGIGGKKFIPDGKVILVPDGQIGRMVWTESNEALAAAANSPYQTSTTADGISLTVSRTSDPAGVKYLVSENVLPLIEMPHSVGVMTVFNADNDKTAPANNSGQTSSSSKGSAK